MVFSRSLNFATAVIIGLSALSVFAAEEGSLRAGLLAGQVGFQGDSSSRSAGGLGAGAFVGYAASDDMIFDVAFLQSSQTGFKHQELNLGLDFYFGGYDALSPQALAGVSFIGNTFDDVAPSTGGTVGANGFGLYVGLGVDFDLSKNLALGLQGKYVKAFESTARLANGISIKGVEDSYSVLVRLAVSFGGGR